MKQTVLKEPCGNSRAQSEVSFKDYLFVQAGFNDSDINPFADKYSMIWLCNQTYKNPLLMNKIIIHGHRPIPVSDCKDLIHSKKNVINLDTGCVCSNMTGYGTLTAIELNRRSLYFAWDNLSAVFAIRESRIINNGYEET